MTGGMLTPLLGFGAGVLTILSPCVLPLVPIVLGSAAQRHRLGPLALSAGLIASFTISGFLIAAVGPAMGLEPDVVRTSGALLLVAAGGFLAYPRAQVLLATSAGRVTAWASRSQSTLDGDSLAGQAGIGLLLGLVWSPCVGPTLGAATALAAQGQDLPQVALTMTGFGTGIASVLLLIAFASRAMFARWRSRLIATGTRARLLMGALLVLVGASILTGFDRLLEAKLLECSPDWMVELSTGL